MVRRLRAQMVLGAVPDLGAPIRAPALRAPVPIRLLPGSVIRSNACIEASFSSRVRANRSTRKIRESKLPGGLRHCQFRTAAIQCNGLRLAPSGIAPRRSVVCQQRCPATYHPRLLCHRPMVGGATQVRSRRLTRRQLVKGAAGGAGVLALGGGAFSATRLLGHLRTLPAYASTSMAPGASWSRGPTCIRRS